MPNSFCFWTIGDKKHGRMAATLVASARKAGVTADFHVWTDLPEIPEAIVHPCGDFDKTLYMFKFHFLKNEVSKLNYDHYFFLDADNHERKFLCLDANRSKSRNFRKIPVSLRLPGVESSKLTTWQQQKLGGLNLNKSLRLPFKPLKKLTEG